MVFWFSADTACYPPPAVAWKVGDFSTAPETMIAEGTDFICRKPLENRILSAKEKKEKRKKKDELVQTEKKTSTRFENGTANCNDKGTFWWYCLCLLQSPGSGAQRTFCYIFWVPFHCMFGAILLYAIICPFFLNWKCSRGNTCDLKGNRCLDGSPLKRILSAFVHLFRLRKIPRYKQPVSPHLRRLINWFSQ